VTSLNLADGDPVTAAVDAVVVGVFDSGDGAPQLAPGAEAVSEALNGGLVDALARLGATGSAGEVTKLATFGAIKAPVLVAVGLGPRNGDIPAETLRRAAGAATRALAGSDRIVLALPGQLRPVAEGALLGAYRFAGYRTRPQAGRREAVRTVSVTDPEGGPARAARAEL
jgi:leucyl aminopeptidase